MNVKSALEVCSLSGYLPFTAKFLAQHWAMVPFNFWLLVSVRVLPRYLNAVLLWDLIWDLGAVCWPPYLLSARALRPLQGARLHGSGSPALAKQPFLPGCTVCFLP